MSEKDVEHRNTGSGGSTGSESGPTTGAGGTTGSDDIGEMTDDTKHEEPSGRSEV